VNEASQAGGRPAAGHRVNFVMVLHSHQPVGNLDYAVEYATDVAYRPFLEVLRDYPELKVSLHYSGSLLEWFEEHDPAMMEGIAEIAGRGQAEIIGGAFYDPILTMLTEADRNGQITTFRDYLERKFAQRPRGAWLAERVWEQCLTRSLVDAGVEYVALDDNHFKNAGLSDQQLVGGFLTEDDGRLLRVYPASEELRYRIPFQDPQRTLELLARYADAAGNHVIVYADDGEKFGSWPETHKHVYENGWLRRFIELLLGNRDWINLVTLSEATDAFPPVGKVYLPDASYREMTEWALPAAKLAEYEDLVSGLKKEGRYEDVKPYLRPGFWRNFKVKYREANLLYGKSLEVSRKVNALLAHPPSPKSADLIEQARMELYRGQCNCPYWHGVFGGLYLPHLRSAAYGKLISAEVIADRLTHASSSWVDLREVDFDLDGHPEVFLSNPRLLIGLAPQRGGHLFELDVRQKQFNVANTLTRRWESYHRNLERDEVGSVENDEQAKSIHEIAAVKSPTLAEKLRYDSYERESLVDHCLQPGVTLKELDSLRYEELAGCVSSPYECVSRRQTVGKATVVLRRSTELRPPLAGRLSVQKEVTLERDAAEVVVTYTLSNQAGAALQFRFAVEWNFSLLAGNAPDRYYFQPAASRGTPETELGPLVSRLSLDGGGALGLRDEWTGLELLLRAEKVDGWFLLPVESVSQSEGGLESVYQSSCVMPHWLIELSPGESTTFELRLSATCFGR